MLTETLENGTRVLLSDRIRFGADALLLANFAAQHLPQTGHVLDLGTGCGILTLRLVDQGFAGAVTAIDIDPEACALAAQSAALNNLSGIHIEQADLRRYSAPRKMDAVLCNPPYFTAGSGAQSTDSRNRTARHETACTLDDAARSAARNLKQGGSLYLCNRPERLVELLETLRRNRLEPKLLQLVRHAPAQPPWLVLIQARYDAGAGLTILPDQETPEN